MALIQCPECGREISDQAEACPGCGYPIAAKRQEEQEQQRDRKLQEARERDRVLLRRAGILLGLGIAGFLILMTLLARGGA